MRNLQRAQTGQAAEHSLSQMADGVFCQVQALQEAQSYKSGLLQPSQMIEGQVSAEENSTHDTEYRTCIFVLWAGYYCIVFILCTTSVYCSMHFMAFMIILFIDFSYFLNGSSMV